MDGGWERKLRQACFHTTAGVSTVSVSVTVEEPVVCVRARFCLTATMPALLLLLVSFLTGRLDSHTPGGHEAAHTQASVCLHHSGQLPQHQPYWARQEASPAHCKAELLLLAKERLPCSFLCWPLHVSDSPPSRSCFPLKGLTAISSHTQGSLSLSCQLMGSGLLNTGRFSLYKFKSIKAPCGKRLHWPFGSEGGEAWFLGLIFTLRCSRLMKHVKVWN